MRKLASRGKGEKLRITIVDKADGEIANVETDAVSLPDHPEYRDKCLTGILDALVEFYRQNPDLTRIDVDVIGSEDSAGQQDRSRS